MISRQKINPIPQQASLPGPCRAPDLNLNVRATERLWQGIVAELCLSPWIRLGSPAARTNRVRRCHIDSSSDAESWEGSKAAPSSSVSTPIPSASLLCTDSILSNTQAEAPTRFFTRNCSWAWEHAASENNPEIVIKCFKGEILPFDSCLVSCHSQPGAFHTA